MRLKTRVAAGIAATALCSGLAVTGATAASAHGASGRATSHAKVTLTWWTWTANPAKVIANFEKAYPYITIKPPPNYGSGGTFYAKLTTALASGTGPDVSQVELDHLPQFIQAKDLQNISQYVSSYKKDFPAWVWSQVSSRGAVYAMPEDIGPMGFMYQPAVLKKYHLAVPTTWAQFATEAVTLHKEDPGQYLAYFPVNDGDYLEGLFWQAGAYPYTLLANGTWKINVDGPIEQKVMAYWGKLVNEKAIATAEDFTANWGHQIAKDQFVSYVGAAWSPTYEIDEYLTPGTTQQYAVTALPQWKAGAASNGNWGGSTNAVTKDAPANLVKDAALFAAYINTSASGLSVDERPATPAGGGRGLFPASLARASVPEFNAPVPHFTGNVNAEFSKLAAEVPKQFQWDPWDTEFANYVTTQMAAAAAGKEPWSQVLKTTQSQLVTYAKDAGYSVEG